MTKNEAVSILEVSKLSSNKVSNEKCKQAVDMAISALKHAKVIGKKYDIKDLEEIIKDYQNCTYGVDCKSCRSNEEISKGITWCRFLILVRSEIADQIYETLNKVL